MATNELKREAHAIFRAALDLETGERPLYVVSACGARTELRDEVDALMASLRETSRFLETPALVSIDRVAMQRSDQARLGRRLGRYRVESVIATGGMGVVYRAEQENPRRTVALKVMRTGFATPSAMRRFEMETETLARMRHPGIAQIYEAGTDQQGALDVPWIALEYVDNASDLMSHAAAGELGTRDRIQLFLDVCDAVHHANLRGVVHRDLKPHNILVDPAGRVKVIDFGVSQLTDSEATSVSFLTAAGHLVGTLPWMSPEQCVPGKGDLDLRCDVYALGVVLYELLTGRRPYDLEGLPIHEATQIICERPPTRPGFIDEELSGDLETIMLTALEKHRERRYASVDAFAADLRRAIAREPILARPATRSYRLRLFFLRNRSLAVAGTLIAATLLVATVVATVFGVRAAQQRDQALWEAYLGSIAAAQAARDAGELDYFETRLAKAPERFRNWEWTYLARDVHDRDRELYRHATMITRGALSRDGTRVATGGRDGAVKVADAGDGTIFAGWKRPSRIRDIVFFPDGDRVVTVEQSGAIEVRAALTGELLSAMKFGGGARRSVDVSPDGRWIAAGNTAGRIAIIEAARSERVHVIAAHDEDVIAMAFSPDGRLLASGSDDGGVKVWRTSDWSLLHDCAGHGSQVEAVTIDATNMLLASASTDHTARVWSLETGAELAVYTHEESGIWEVSFAPDGTLAIGFERGIDLWDHTTGTTVLGLRGHSELPGLVGFTPDGAAMISCAWDKTVLRWDLRPGPPEAGIPAHTELIHDVTFDPGGHRLYSASHDGTVKAWDVHVGDELASYPVGTSGIGQRALAVSPDGAVLVAGDNSGRIRCFETATTRPIRSWKAHRGWVTRVEYSPDGQFLVTGGRDGLARVYRADGTPVVDLDQHDSTVRAIAFSPDGEILATGSWDHRVILWRVPDFTVIRTLTDHAFDVYALAWNSDGTLLASGSRDRVIIVWDRDGNLVARREGHGQFIADLDFHPTEPRLASSGWFGPVRIWDTEHFESLLPLDGHRGRVRAIDWSPDGRLLATAGQDGRICLWDRTRGDELRDRTAAEFARRSRLAAYVSEPDAALELTAAEHATLANLRLMQASPLPPAAGPEGGSSE